MAEELKLRLIPEGFSFGVHKGNLCLVFGRGIPIASEAGETKVEKRDEPLKFDKNLLLDRARYLARLTKNHLDYFDTVRPVHSIEVITDELADIVKKLNS